MGGAREYPMVIGIVCEYNPFHNGHLHQLRRSREAAGEDTTVVCVLSGDFVQRGEASPWTKFARAEAACRCGADLVAELPLPWCLSSAEGFARGAVGLLAALGARRLSFGSESGDAEGVKTLAALLREPAFTESVKRRLRENPALSFAAARQLEAEARLGAAGALLGQPNDILAVEYAKAVQSLEPNMELFAVKRLGSGHDRPGTGEGYPSASALRGLFAAGERLAGRIPPEAAGVLGAQPRIDPERLETALLSRLRLLDASAFDALPDAANGLGKRLCRAVREQGSLAEIHAAAATKRYPTARIRRALLCACLGITDGLAAGIPPYARILAANARGREHLRRLADSALVPVLTKPAAVKTLDARSAALFTLGAAAHDLYVLGYPDPELRRPGEDWRRSPVMV